MKKGQVSQEILGIAGEMWKKYGKRGKDKAGLLEEWLGWNEVK